MKKILAALAICGIPVWFCPAQDPGTSGAATASVADDATFKQQMIVSSAQFDLLNQLAQEHRKRAAEIPADQARSQWETELAKELADRAAAILNRLNSTNKDRLAYESAHPELAATGLPISLTAGTNRPGSAELAFLDALAARRTAIQQELATASEAGNLYVMQLATNTASSEISQIHSQIRANANSMKQLQKELFDLELKNLEFRALRSSPRPSESSPR